MFNLKSLEHTINYTFKQPELLQLALTHKSFCSSHNERLEFLGDSVVGFIVASELFRRSPNSGEGQLSTMRAKLVCKESLAQVGKQLQLGNYLQVGDSMLHGGYRFDSILCNTFEAIIGAIYEDGGIQPCQQLVFQYLIQGLDTQDMDFLQRDAKSRLQELLQKYRLPLPVYEPIENNEVNNDEKATETRLSIRCTVTCNERFSNIPESGVTASGQNRKIAEQAAAQGMLDLIQAQF